MRIVGLLVVALSVGCAPQWGEPIDHSLAMNAISRWPLGGNLHACMLELAEERVTVYTTSAQDTDAICDNTELRGCAKSATRAGVTYTSIILRNSMDVFERADTIEHELRHWLGHCALGDDGDGEHKDERRWGYLYNGRNVL